MRIRSALIFATLAALALAGCGNRRTLKPGAGQEARMGTIDAPAGGR